MKQSIFLCSRKWYIRQIFSDTIENQIQPGALLTDLICNPESLTQNEDLEVQKITTVFLQFHNSEEYPALICIYPRHYLVFLEVVKNREDFSAFADSYTHFAAWAEDHLQEPFRDEYYQIQQMNNQLINSQRALIKANQQLKNVLNEVRTAHNTIAVLERDELTEFYRLPAFYQKVRQCLDAAPSNFFDIIVLDIERFKLINETFGRKAGDTLLQKLAIFLMGLENAEKGFFSRASADTFFIFMPEDLHFYQSLQQHVSAFFQNYPLPIHVHEKLGVYTVTSDMKISVEQMCDRARLALDTVAFKDDTRLAFYDQKLHKELLLQHRILDSVPQALEKREFKLYLQPKFDMITGNVIGAEALIRWIHPELGFIPPDKFIPLLEKEGGIYAIDRYIWEEACSILHARQKNGQKILPVSVNVARSDLYQEDLPFVLQELLNKYQLDASSLRLEVLERAYVNDTDNILNVLSNLRKQGFWIEMDDFGTGESSLSMLAEMPIDVLKLDRQFLITSLQNKRQIDVMRFIIDIANTLDIRVIAEGVETKEQADLLCSMGCRYAQGYYYAKPEPAEKFLEIS